MKKITLLLILFLLSCNSYKSIPLNSLEELKAPPGTTQLSENLFFDLTEVTNFHWFEYQSWIKNIYGEDSEEYKKTIPKPNVWSELNENYSEFDKYYLSHPSYRQYPVVGVSYEQALAYSQWRSDRVMQYNLIAKRIIAEPISNDKDSVFTIEKYFSGQYLNYKPNEKIRLYPEYSLPDSTSFFKFSHFADSVNALVFKSGKNKKYSKELLENCIENKTDSLPFGPSPAKSVVSNSKKLIISHLKGNVREMTDVKGAFYGLSFIDSCDANFNKVRYQDHEMKSRGSLDDKTQSRGSLVNSYTGFRNMCSYKEWERL